MKQRSLLAQRIRDVRLAPDEIAVFFIAQAGFVFKTAAGVRLILDPYLSDCVEREVGFKRMTPNLLPAEDVEADIFAVTHSHLDHLDTDILPILARKRGISFVGSPDCAPLFAKAHLPERRCSILHRGESWTQGDIRIRAVYCDHGELAPDAVGFLISLGDITVYNVGDSSLALDNIKASLGETSIDIMIAPINGVYGNLNEEESCRLASALKPRVMIPSHFGMFVEQGGSPLQFLTHAAKLTGITPALMAPGECIRYSKARGLTARNTLRQNINE